MTLARLQQQNYTVQAMARVLHRLPSTISRELSRNADVSGYTSSKAQKRCQHRRESARPVRRELVACLRQAHNKRTPRSKGQDRRGQIPDMLSIHLRPPEIEDRQFPGHWEGDLIKGEANASAVGTLVERASRLLMLIKLPHPSRPARPMCCKPLVHDSRQDVSELSMSKLLATASGTSVPRYSVT